jgi:hypothetical protein
LRSFVSVLQELKDIAKPNCFSPTELKVEFSIMNTTNNDFFSIINVNDTFKIISITFAILMMAALLPFLAGIVWFERFGSDKKRTLINMLVVSIILTVFQCGCLVQTIDIIRYLSGPWSEVFCLMQAILRSSLLSILYYTMMPSSSLGTCTSSSSRIRQLSKMSSGIVSSTFGSNHSASSSRELGTFLQ